MKAKIISDLHLEFGDWLAPGSGELLIVAGDLHTGNKGLKWLKQASENFDDVILVLGNHEFYHNDVEKVLEIEYPENVHRLHNQIVEIKGRKFAGSTLWSKVTDHDLIMRSINDYRLIKYNGAALTTVRTNQFHEHAKFFLEHTVDKDTVVITHHMPSYQLVAKMYEGSPLNQSYASDLDDIVGRARLWISGHTHSSFDMEINGTRCICNPKGYFHENPDFNPNLVLEI